MSRLTIITVCLNEVETIEKTMQSVLSQTFQDFEWIIVDGLSTDGTLEIIKKYAHRIDIMISEKDNGVYDAMNKGIARAKSEYIYFLNGGDFIVSENTLEKIFSRKLYGDIVYGDIIAFDSLGRQTLMKMPSKITKHFHFKKTLPHQSTLIKKSLFDLVGHYDINYKIASDYYFTMKAIFKYHCSTQYIDEVFAVFGRGGLSENVSLREKEKKRIQQKVFTLSQIIACKILNQLILLKFFLKQKLVRLINL